MYILTVVAPYMEAYSPIGKDMIALCNDETESI
jgi:hypothetical protein